MLFYQAVLRTTSLSLRAIRPPSVAYATSPSGRRESFLLGELASVSETERLVRLLYADLQRIAVDDGDGVVGVEKVAEGGGAALFGEGAFNAVAGDAQSEGAHLRLVVAEIAAVPLDEELAVGPPEPEQGHSAAVLGDLDGSGAALEADGQRLLKREVVASVLFGKAAPGHQLHKLFLFFFLRRFFHMLLDAALDADALILVTEWKEFRLPTWGVIKKAMKQPVVLDGRNIYDGDELQEMGFVYHCIGR